MSLKEYNFLQIVCGISAMVMGSVAFIEERQKFNMGLGIPAGGISVLAAGKRKFLIWHQHLLNFNRHCGVVVKLPVSFPVPGFNSQREQNCSAVFGLL